MNKNEKEWNRANEQISALKKEIAKAIVGQELIIEQMLTTLISHGHCLIIGVPGLAKTLLVNTLGKILGLSFNRIQFTPDMMPSDIIGCEILQENDEGKRGFNFVKGPVFANLILADEINRTPPKTQSALLEAMQERQVTASGKTMAIPEPFVVFATQNPIEHEGTYPLPEAQLDRFFYCLNINYPSLDEERRIVELTTGKNEAEVSHVLDIKDVIALQNLVTEIPVPEHIMEYILKFVHSTRPGGGNDFVDKYVAWGAGPRASQNLTRAARAIAMLRGRPVISEEEVRDAILPVLRHRIIPSYNAVGEGITVETIIENLLKLNK
jgi:MoxR-like ATPase